MRMNSNVALLLAAGTFGLAASAAQAGPAVGSLKGAPDTSLTQIDYRKCWWEDGDRVCRWFKGSRSLASRSNEYVDVGTRRPEEFATGSTEWWRAMDRDGRGGFGRR